MKKLVVAVATVFVAAVFVSGVGAGNRGGTLVDSGFGCGILDGNGSIFVTSNSELWLYDNGKAVLKCSGNGAASTPPSLILWNNANTGLLCGSQYGATTDWVDKVGYNGNSQLTCTFDVRDGAAGAGAGIG